MIDIYVKNINGTIKQITRDGGAALNETGKRTEEAWKSSFEAGRRQAAADRAGRKKINNAYDKVKTTVTESQLYKSTMTMVKDKIMAPMSAAFEQTKKAFNHYSKKVFWYSKNQIENFLFGNKRKGTSGMLTGLSKKMEDFGLYLRQKGSEIKDSVMAYTWGTESKPGILRTAANTIDEGILQPLKRGVMQIFEITEDESGKSLKEKMFDRIKEISTNIGDSITSNVSKFFGAADIHSMSDLVDKMKLGIERYSEIAGNYLQSNVFEPLGAKMEVWKDKFTVAMDDIIKEIEMQLMWKMYDNEITQAEYADSIKHIESVKSINKSMSNTEESTNE
jgi:hypothetical protein